MRDLRRSLYNISTNSSNKNSVSVGPGVASGWNWTAKKGRRLWRMPSTVPSLAFSKEISQSSGMDFESIA